MTLNQDIAHMQTCLKLAAKAAGRTKPNPLVGSVVLDADGNVVAEGFHERAGMAHAEVAALDQAGDAARGGTLYVNLEPCSHWGKTPPCANRIVESGVARVVAAMVDPNPLVAGKGIAILQAAGIAVDVGVLEAESRWLNRGFIKKMTVGLPWLCLKLAVTLDGRIADRTGSSRWITGSEARAHVHKLRNELDCVLVGGATAVADDPQLNVRDIPNGRSPLRAVVDSALKVSPESRLCQRNSGGPTVIFIGKQALNDCGKTFPENVRLIAIDSDQITGKHIDLAKMLAWLVQDGNLTVLCEGGGRLSASLIANGLVDELHWIVSPKLLADEQAIPAIAPLGQVLLSDARQLSQVSYSQLGNDMLIQGVLNGKVIS